MKTYAKQINSLFIFLVFLISTESYSEEKLITLKLTANTENILNFKTSKFGIKANTSGGKVEVRMYVADQYNFDHKRDNLALVYGFFSENRSDNAEFYQTYWIADESWPLRCYGIGGVFCSDANKTEIKSRDLSFMRKRLKNYFFEKHYHLGFDNEFYRMGGGTIDLIVEIDYNLPGSYNDFKYDLKLPGFDLIRDVDIANLLELQKQNNPPPFVHFTFATTPYLPTDKSAFTSIEFKEDDFEISLVFSLLEKKYISYNYLARYDNNQDTSIRIIKQKKGGVFFTREEADAIANDIAYKIGQIPLIARKGLWKVNVFDAFHLKTHHIGGFSSQMDGSLTIRTDTSTEIILHEACHSSLDWIQRESSFLSAQKNDLTYISEYNRALISIESISESFPAWVKLRYKTEIDSEKNTLIEQAIPGTIAYFDNKFTPEDMYPLIPDTQTQHTRFTLASPSNNNVYELGDPIQFLINRESLESDPVKITFYLNTDVLLDETTTNDFNISKEFYIDKGTHEITIRATYSDGTTSSIGAINFEVKEPPLGDYKINLVGQIFSSNHYSPIPDFPVHIEISRLDGNPVSGNPNIMLFADNVLIETETEGNNPFKKIWKKYHFKKRYLEVPTTFKIEGIIQFDQENSTSLKKYESLDVNNIYWEINTFGPPSMPLGIPITIGISRKHLHNLTGQEVYSNIKIYANDQEIPYDTEGMIAKDVYDFERGKISFYRIWNPQKEGNYTLTGTIENNGKTEYLSPVNFEIKSPIKRNNNNKIAFPQTNTTTEKETFFILYPNPSKDGSFDLKFDLKNDSPASVKIFDLIGRLVYSKNYFYLTKGENKLFFEKKDTNLTTGIYTIELTNNEFKETNRLIVK